MGAAGEVIVGVAGEGAVRGDEEQGGKGEATSPVSTSQLFNFKLLINFFFNPRMYKGSCIAIGILPAFHPGNK